MSWIVASFLLLGAALAVGFGWYERTHPSARVLALVATLAALAALGRVAFAPLPNVKPTTDIVLLTGYVLGGAPGFAVGAIAALASNLFFGQGPWTPWQMAGWAGAGLLGAGMARVFGRELGRWSLAAACGVAGLLFGALMNLSHWITYSGDHTLAKLGTVAVTSLPFDLAHATGNVLFCLAFGPALVRALRRYRMRFDVTWRPAPAATTAALGAALVAVLLLAAPPERARADAPEAAVRYLERAQNRDGGFGPAPGTGSTQMHTGWAAIGLAAAGRNPRDLDHDTLAYIRSHADALRGDLGERSRTILAMRAAGARSFKAGGRDLLAEIAGAQQEDGSWAGRVNTTAFAVLALRAAGRPADSAAVRAGIEFIAGQANDDGGFNFAGRGRPSGADDTSAALQALAAAGRRRSGVARRAVRWLESVQNADGGFSLVAGSSNAQSTAWAVQALVAAGRDPAKVRRGGSRSPMAYLRSLVGSDGAIRYSRTSTQTPVWVTAQAVAALARKALPLKPVPRERKRTAVPAPTATPAPVPAAAPAPTATPRGARTAEPVPLEADGHGVAEPELRRNGERVSAADVVAQLPSPLEIGLARAVALPIGPAAGAAGALAAVLVRMWRPPASGY
jgi:energy-coupling factor transport system substrate-specific component